MYVVLIYEERDLDTTSKLAWPYSVTEVRGPFTDQDRANQYIRNHLPDSLAINAQSWKVDNL